MIHPLLLDSFVLGIQHSFEPDHLAAVSVLTSEKKKGQLWRVAWRSSHWALGHAFSLILFACLILLLKSQLSLEVASWVEYVVGPLMIYLGIVAIRRNFKNDPVRPTDASNAAATPLNRSFGVGMIHGLAGTGGACTVALTLAAKDASTAVWIIIIQSLSILLAMTIYGCVFAFSLQKVAQRTERVLRWMNYLIGVFSIAVGVLTLVDSF
ncbi:cytochrome c biogenesis protein CcdA [Siphonobacter sp.]|uniref:cytochrome c biogenesis protein CcdA n=1 Tax=Siphonobacter sp. TaxID=1869184 RepID=UPI003B3BBB98